MSQKTEPKKEPKWAAKIRGAMANMPTGGDARLRIPDYNPDRTAEEWLCVLGQYLTSLRIVWQEHYREAADHRRELDHYRQAVQLLRSVFAKSES